MTASDPTGFARRHGLAVLVAVGLVLALLPPSGAASAQEGGACPADVPEAPFTDREEISSTHRTNVDCAAAREIVTGFEDDTYRPDVQVRRDQMASFIALTLDAAGFTLPAGESTFTDVPADSVHAVNINRLAAAGIIEGGALGLPADQYGPALRTRRDQMASFLMRAAGFALEDDVDAFDSAEQQFTDVPAGNVHSGKVNSAALNEVALGVGAELFAPNQETRRDQMATFVVRLLNFLDDPDGGDDPFAVEIMLDILNGPPGTTVTATVTGDVDHVESVAVVGDCLTDRDVPLEPDRTFTFTIEEDAEEGACDVNLTAHFDDETTLTLSGTFIVTGEAAPSVSVSLSPTTGAVGTAVTASFSGDSDRVESIDIAGACVDDAEVPLTGNTVTFDITSGDGDCGISFTVAFDDDSTQALTSTFIVEAGG